MPCTVWPSWAEDGVVSCWEGYIDELMGGETVTCGGGLSLYTSTRVRGLLGTGICL
jgi:hypothetical protein